MERKSKYTFDGVEKSAFTQKFIEKRLQKLSKLLRREMDLNLTVTRSPKLAYQALIRTAGRKPHLICKGYGNNAAKAIGEATSHMHRKLKEFYKRRWSRRYHSPSADLLLAEETQHEPLT